MKILQFAHTSGGPLQVGALSEHSLITPLPDFKDSLSLIQAGDDGLQRVQEYIKSTDSSRIPLENVRLFSPISGPDKVLCIGMNYRDHCEEQGIPLPKEPIVFNKFPSCIIGPYDDLRKPQNTEELDWEVELAVVMGRRCADVSRESAMDYVFGYTVAHDVSARDWQLKRNGGQWLLGKAMEGFCPLGPVLVTPDDLPDPHDLSISCSVNGETKQSSNTSELVFGVDEIVSWISRVLTLLPGDVILTGTPPGVGVFAKPPQFLKVGDIVKCEISGIGSVVNRIV
eukprot:TRINITY_DN5275_c0_g1_i1.p1 TRINITY_DN5275_c0_g1~~TRINITY_DN5275_c0_g1_i1.p1  ORF type:complete len:284 (+),score=42.88 TRINITY_DN5275_c0_g1_i1:57-908(+)